MARALWTVWIHYHRAALSRSGEQQSGCDSHQPLTFSRSLRAETLRVWGRVIGPQRGVTRGFATTWGLGERMRHGRWGAEDKGWVKRDLEWVKIQASSAAGLEKTRPVEETITDKEPKSLHIYLYMREYTQLEDSPDSLSSNGESVTRTVTAPTA